MKQKRLRISLVIPAYNEERHLRACLEAVAAQTVTPFEVIVVDNNSTDATAQIAREFAFVRVVQEPHQGLVYARDAGFNAARGDIIGRIDVDSLIPRDWIERVQRIFIDDSIDAVSGSLGFHDAPFHAFFARAELICRRYMARNLGREGELFLYGGNMAARRSLWHGVRDELCRTAHLHEDMDLAAHLSGSQYRIIFDENLRVDVSVRRIDTGIRAFYTYVLANPRTYAAHGLASRRYMYPIAWLVLLFYLPLRLLYRAYDPELRQLSLRRIAHPINHERPSPVSSQI